MHNPLEDRRIGLLLLKLSLPSFMGMAVMALYNVMGTIFIGRAVGPLGIAALSVVFPLQMFFAGLGEMVGMGGASLVSRALGERDMEKAQYALGNAWLSVFCLSILVMVLGLSFDEPLGHILGGQGNYSHLVLEYLRVVFCAGLLQFTPMVLAHLIRSEGNARWPMAAMVTSALLNIGLDAFFILKLKMGIKGAAYAMVISQFVSLVILSSYYILGKSFVKPALWALWPRSEILGSIFAVGVSSLARTLVGSLSAVFVNRTLVLYGGELSLSAFGILNRLAMLAIMPSIAIGNGLQPILGFNYGARRKKEALRALWLSAMATFGIGLGVSLLIYFFPRHLISIFTKDTALISLSLEASRKMFLALYLAGFSIMGSVVFQALGKAKKAFLLATARPALFMIPLVAILSHFYGTTGIWVSFPTTDTLSFLLALVLILPVVKELKG